MCHCTTHFASPVGSFRLFHIRSYGFLPVAHHTDVPTALSFIDYCHSCGDEAVVRKKLLNAFYPQPSARASENIDSATYFESLLPDLNAVISTKLAHAVHDEYRSKTGHCLFRENVGVEATMQVSTPTEALHFCTTPSSDSCTPSRILSEENFEDGSLTGWTNGRTTLDPTFSHFLGRYGQEDMGKYPRKTYFIPMDAEEVVLEYDMYEIDSWDGHRGDSATVYLDGKRINLGTFRHRKRENGRTGFAHGVSFRLDSAPLPTTSAFGQWEDEIHHVTMRVPKSFYRSDGELKVEFRWSLNQGLIDESIGFDNIKLTAEFDCTGKSSCARSD